jgi:hypothetical protein
MRWRVPGTGISLYLVRAGPWSLHRSLPGVVASQDASQDATTPAGQRGSQSCTREATVQYLPGTFPGPNYTRKAPVHLTDSPARTRDPGPGPESAKTRRRKPPAHTQPGRHYRAHATSPYGRHAHDLITRALISLVRYREIRINRTKFGANQG